MSQGVCILVAMLSPRDTRRAWIEKCAAKGLLLGSLSQIHVDRLLGAEDKHPTQWNEIGPFYRKGAPGKTRLCRESAPGMPLDVSGDVFNTSGSRVDGVSIEVWHADITGHYDIEGYECRGKFALDNRAAYGFTSVLPGHYPDRIAQHIHYLIQAPGHKPLVTQLYFATDPAFKGDPGKHFANDPLVRNPSLIRPVELMGEGRDITARVRFDLVLEKL
jgi:protocatechuate 3,4-dioxygenase beta subunit